jgi:hypothetical protein
MQQILRLVLVTGVTCLCSAFVSTNVPLGHWSYDAIDKLIGQGLIDSSMMTTKPVSRLEMARHIAEAIEKAQKRNDNNTIIPSILGRLEAEFRPELIVMDAVEGKAHNSFIKPVEDPYVKYVYADSKPDLENMRGDTFEKRSNYRAGFASRMKFFDSAAFYFHPEFAASSWDSDEDIVLVEGYGKVALGIAEIELGRDSLWWGPGYQGSLIMSNNAEPFRIVKVSTPGPIELPWILRILGPSKLAWFLTELESDRVVSDAKLTGARFHFKPHPAVEFGASRVIMFGGSGMPSVDLVDYLKMWRPGREQVRNNQLAGVDVSVLLPLGPELPVRSIKLYGDFAGEDEAGSIPSNWGKLLGIQFNDIFRTARTDLRVEYADNHVPSEPNVFYTHNMYRSGYTYEDRIIGHHMGTDARDLFVRLTHYVTEDLILGLDYEREVQGFSSQSRQRRDIFGLDLTYFHSDDWRLKTGLRYENFENSNVFSPGLDDNKIFYIEFTHEF